MLSSVFGACWGQIMTLVSVSEYFFCSKLFALRFLVDLFFVSAKPVLRRLFVKCSDRDGDFVRFQKVGFGA